MERRRAAGKGSMKQNVALARLREGRPINGAAIVYDSPSMVEQAALVGLDYLWLDWQHGQWSEHTLNDALARCLHSQTTPIVRVKGNEPGTINRVLDMGAMGVIVPYVQDADQARAAVQAAFYPPIGTRSGGGVRLGLIGDGTPDYFSHANEEVLLAVMVETEHAIANVEEIMRVPGVSIVLIGPGDLMIDVKSRGGNEARHEQLVQQVADASRRTGTPCGYVTGNPEEATARVRQGFTFLNCGSDFASVDIGLRAAAALAKSW
jgi:4-hydroxy-2-oxoheptanedioate aldolase